MNGSILILAKVIKNVVSSAPEAEIAALSMNVRPALPLRVVLEEMGYKQSTMELITDDSTAEGILSGKIKQNRSKGIDMQYCCLHDRVSRGQFTVTWKAGSANLADYFTKHQSASYHKALQPIYLFDENCRLDLQGYIKILTTHAAGKKHKHKANQENKLAMKISYSKVNTMSELTKCVSRMKSQLHAPAA